MVLADPKDRGWVAGHLQPTWQVREQGVTEELPLA